MLSRQNLAQFGRLRIPAPLWQALGQYACRLDPVIVPEWRQLTANRDSTANRHSATTWGAAASDNAIADRDDAAEGGPATDDAFEWTEGRYDTRVVLERAKELRDSGFALRCVWSASRIRSSPHIDHCFPWARWGNNDLWNLPPARDNINLSKSGRLPSSGAMADARGRILEWWRHAWVGSAREVQFFMEARHSLPGICDGSARLEVICPAALRLRGRLTQDQQMAEWLV